MALASGSLRGLAAPLRPAAAAALKWAERNGVQVTVTSVQRTRAKQQKLYRDYIEGRSRFPAAPPGQSAHEYGLAWDSFVEERFVDWWKAVRRAYGWQVPDSDWVHAQLPNWEQYVR